MLWQLSVDVIAITIVLLDTLPWLVQCVYCRSCDIANFMAVSYEPWVHGRQGSHRVLLLGDAREHCEGKACPAL